MSNYVTPKEVRKILLMHKKLLFKMAIFKIMKRKNMKNGAKLMVFYLLLENIPFLRESDSMNFSLSVIFIHTDFFDCG